LSPKQSYMPTCRITILLYATLRVANRATRNVGERRRGNDGAKRPTDLADANPGAPARARSAYNLLDDVLPSLKTLLFPIFLKYFCFKVSLEY